MEKLMASFKFMIFILIPIVMGRTLDCDINATSIIII